MDHTPLHTRSRMLSKHYKRHDQLLDPCHRHKGSALRVFLCCAGLAVSGLALALFAYCAGVVVKARLDTPAIMSRALAPGNITLAPAALPRRRLDQLIKIEDPAFLTHKGVDMKTPGAGLTTITQALVKIFYFKEFKPGFAKLRQTLIARYAMHPLVSKQDQLTLLLNYAYLGHCGGERMRGFPAAARCYYRKDVSRLKEDEYLSLVGMLIAPDTFSPILNPQANKERLTRVKKVVSGEYVPASHMDVYYGALSPEVRTALAPASYFSSIYEN